MDISMQIIWAKKKKTENSKKKQEWQPTNVEERQEIKEHSGQRKKKNDLHLNRNKEKY